ncbi:MAG TPA: hypothetical protein VJV79_40680 [Polyangiaceae bacterium]|nr:hypothetical protein [Polyangiaceae bacterium]
MHRPNLTPPMESESAVRRVAFKAGKRLLPRAVAFELAIVISAHALKLDFSELLAVFASYRPKRGTR